MFEPRESVAAWREFIGHKVLKLDIEPHSDDSFRADATIHMFPELGIFVGGSTAALYDRPKRLVGNDDCLFIIGLEGSARYSGRSEEVVANLGDAVFTGGGESGFKDSRMATRSLSLQVPRSVLASAIVGLDESFGQRVPAQTPALRLMRHYLDALDDLESGLTDPALRRQFATHVHDLVAMAIGATRDAAEIAKGRGVRAARLQAIRSEVRESLARGDLSIAAIAARHRLPVRYVQRLFEEEGTTFTEFVLNERLALAHRILTKSRNANLKISAVAIHAGFGSLSYFNEAFRRRYGASPTDVRAQAQREFQ